MPLEWPAQLLRVVLKLIAIGFAGLLIGFLLTPATWRHRATLPVYVAEVSSVRDTAPDLPPVLTPTPVMPRSLATVDMRIGPGAGYLVIGSLPPGAKLEIIGRDATGDWLAITFVADQNLNAWLPRQLISDPPDFESLPLAPVTFLPLMSR